MPRPSSSVRPSSSDREPTVESPDLIEAEAHELMARAHQLLARAARVRANEPDQQADELVPVAESGLDARTRRELEREGRLPVVKLGRRKYTRRSALVALVAETPQRHVSPINGITDPREAARAAYHATGGARLKGDHK